MQASSTQVWPFKFLKLRRKTSMCHNIWGNKNRGVSQGGRGGADRQRGGGGGQIGREGEGGIIRRYLNTQLYAP